MKSFGEITKHLVNERVGLIKEHVRDSKDKFIDYYLIACYLDDINNIDEVARIEIGALTTSLIEAIKTAIRYHRDDYEKDFNRFCFDYIGVFGVDNNNKPKGPLYADVECRLLGISIDDLSCLKNSNPEDESFGDNLRELININMGTNIPMAGVEEQANREYNEAKDGGNQDEIAKAFVSLREIQRDSGTLRIKSVGAPNGDGRYCTYYVLANDEDYQSAKNALSQNTK